LELDFPPGIFSSQERLPWQELVDGRMGSTIVIPHTNPITDAWKIGSRLAGVEKPARQLGG
jgi:hypothetical protein